MLFVRFRVPNLHEIMLDRVIAFGHSWSPTLELAPQIPLRHGHAINIDMAFSATVAWKRGLITQEERDRILRLMSRVGLALDHELFEIELVWKATKSIMLTRDGKQRAAMPNPIGECAFVNDLTYEELKEGLQEHKNLVKTYPRAGAGLDAFVDQSDYMDTDNTETNNADTKPKANNVSSSKSSTLSVEINSMQTEKGYCTLM
jgi:demethyl-4-deoxygadusol synthase